MLSLERSPRQPDPAIQDAELEVMKVLWAAGEPLPLARLRQTLAARCGWEDSTTKTLLRRLQTKGAVRLVQRGVYAAALSEDDYAGGTAQTLADKLFGGSARRLVAALASTGKLTDADMTELSALFQELTAALPPEKEDAP